MLKEIITLPSIKLIGITARTSNLDESNISTAKIGLTIAKYFGERMYENIPNKKSHNNITYAVYTDYESDHNGQYTYFIGTEVNFIDPLMDNKINKVTKEVIEGSYRSITIPSQKYIKFTNNQYGVMPDVCIDMWNKIWKMSHKKLGGNRSYLADFEFYDERSSNPKSSILDIYIGIKE